MTDARELTAVSPYGIGHAGYRERVAAWLDRFGIACEEHCYFGRSATASEFGLGSLAGAARAEVALRRLRHRRPPALVMHREASPFSAGRLEAGLLAAAGRSVYDIDDAMYADHGGDRLLRRMFAKAKTAEASVAHASITVAGNETIADWAATFSRDVRIVPTCVDPADYDTKTEYDLPDRPRIVWIGSPSTIRHLRLVEEPLLRLHRDLDADLMVIGGSVADTPLASMTTEVEWSAENQRHHLAHADIGIMPLNDDPFERGKCGYKLLQYAVAGLPAVASPIGVNATMTRQFDALGPERTDDWYDALSALITEPSIRRSARADQARNAVDSHYSFDAWAPAWRAVIADLDLDLTAAGPLD